MNQSLIRCSASGVFLISKKVELFQNALQRCLDGASYTQCQFCVKCSLRFHDRSYRDITEEWEAGCTQRLKSLLAFAMYDKFSCSCYLVFNCAEFVFSKPASYEVMTMKFMKGSRIRSCHRRWTLTSKDETVRRCYASWNHHFQRQRDRSEASRDLAEPLARSGACERNFCFVWGLTSQWSSQDLFFQQKCNHPWGVGSSSGVSMHPLRSELGMACKLPQVLRGFCRQYTDMWR